MAGFVSCPDLSGSNISTAERSLLFRGSLESRCCHDNAFQTVFLPIVATTMPSKTFFCPLLSRQCLPKRFYPHCCHDNGHLNVRMGTVKFYSHQNGAVLAFVKFYSGQNGIVLSFLNFTLATSTPFLVFHYLQASKRCHFGSCNIWNSHSGVDMPFLIFTGVDLASGCPLLPRLCLSGRSDVHCCHDYAFPDVRMPIVVRIMPFRTSGCPLLSR